MKTCPDCQALFPGFILRCLRCGRDLGPSSFRELIALAAKYRTGEPRGTPTALLLKSRLNGASPAQYEAQLRRDIRGECQQFFDTLTHRLAHSYSRAQFTEALRESTADSLPPAVVESNALQLVTTLAQIAGLREGFEEKLRREEEHRRATEGQLREAQRRALERQQLAEEARRLAAGNLAEEGQQSEEETPEIHPHNNEPLPLPVDRPQPPTPPLGVRGITQMIRRLTALGATPADIAAAVAAAIAQATSAPGHANHEPPMTQDDFGTV